MFRINHSLIINSYIYTHTLRTCYSKDVVKALVYRVVLWGDELDELLKILPKKPVDLVAMAMEKEGMDVSPQTMKNYVNPRNVKDARLAFVLRKLVCPKKPTIKEAVEGEDTYADQENSLVLNPDAWAITMFLSIVCCSGSDSQKTGDR